MAQLNETHMAAIKEIFEKDENFRSVVQQRLTEEATAATERADRLRQAASFGGDVQKVQPVRRGRPPKAKETKETGSKVDVLLKVIGRGGSDGLTTEEIREGMGKAGVEMGSKMLNSYLYQQGKSGKVSASGPRGTRRYSLVASSGNGQ